MILIDEYNKSIEDYIEEPALLGYTQIEFKFSSSTKQALLQIKDKKYYEKYLADNRQICLVGMNFDYENRTIVECVMEKVKKR